MPTYLPPVPLPDLQRYLKDISVDTSVITLMTDALQTATERVYTYLDRDYTPNAPKTDIFFGNDRSYHFLRYQAGALTSWKYVDSAGVETDAGTTSLKLFSNGRLIVSKEKKFESAYEHQIGYTMPSTLMCPEQVRQVILEIAAEIFEASKQGAGAFGIVRDQNTEYLPLAPKHEYLLAPYKRMPL